MVAAEAVVAVVEVAVAEAVVEKEEVEEEKEETVAIVNTDVGLLLTIAAV